MKRYLSSPLRVLFCIWSIVGCCLLFLWWLVTESWRMPDDVEDDS